MRDSLRSLWILPSLFFITAALSKSADPLSFLYELADYNLSLPIGFQASLEPFPPIPEESLCQNCHHPEDQPSDHPRSSQK